MAVCDDDGVVNFCGKQNENPNFGTTNLDTIFYALLMVFQCTTLEGWSNIQTYYQQTYAQIIWVYFVLMVFIGAFFLMNLTLAVINASFTRSQKAMKAQELQKRRFEELGAMSGDQQDNNNDAAGAEGIA